MKDITISGKRVIRELITLLVCFVIGTLVNLLAIIIYKSNFGELFSSLHYVLVFSLVIYMLWCFIRLIVSALKYMVLLILLY
ncbi:MAG: hypothetical protein Q7U47_09050 [Paludibacter sp.]|nr:hypothetical protein [Paludibacter sp.]